MIAPQRQTKAAEIIDQIKPYLTRDAVANTFELKRYKQILTTCMGVDASECYAALGMIAAIEWDEKALDYNFSNAIRLDSEYTVHMNYATCLQIVGRYVDAWNQVKIACELAPTDFFSIRHAITLNILLGDIESAKSMSEHLHRLGGGKSFAEVSLVDSVFRVIKEENLSLDLVRACNKEAIAVLREHRLWSYAIDVEADTDDNAVFVVLRVNAEQDIVEMLDLELGARLFDKVEDFNPALYWVGYEKALLK